MINYIYNIITFVSKKDRIHLTPKNIRVRSILYYNLRRAIIGYYKPILAYKLPNHFNKIILFQQEFSVFNLPCSCVVTPFCSCLHYLDLAKSVHTKPKSRLYFKHYIFNMQIYIIFTKVAKENIRNCKL